MNIHVASPGILARALMRKKREVSVQEGVNLGLVLQEIMQWADRLVPSEAGSILLDDPLLKLRGRKSGKLYFAACFGKNSSNLAGNAIKADYGIAGETYLKQKAYLCTDTAQDVKFCRRIDRKLNYNTRSIVSVPIKIRGSVVGVIEMINRKSKKSYDENDLMLLEIFAGYTGTLMENTLAAREFEELSIRDSLTGLYNDRHLFHRLEVEIEHAGRKNNSLIFFDLDRFKEINDRHGHLAGSRVLSEIGSLLASMFDKTDAICARYGGDEFALFLPRASKAKALKHAEAIRSEIENRTFLSKRGKRGERALKIKGVITCSIGVASQREDLKAGRKTYRELADSLLSAADNAMYEAKRDGKNRVYASSRRR